MDRTTRDLILAGLTRAQLLAAVARVHDALYLVFADGGPAGPGFAYRAGTEWTPDTLEAVAEAVDGLPGLRRLTSPPATPAPVARPSSGLAR